ncbi:hypothetical protein [Parahaliea mediterranea]|uniref:hypothetical protein n=1 Tax=Parahaliea mediterranea TaxID=651086 RepID=UPI0013003EDD|nr:hypothetical protein [Parahaliea mediterranea]
MTDIFFALFGIFVVLRAISPHYETGELMKAQFEISWPAKSSKDCFLDAWYEDGAGPQSMSTHGIAVGTFTATSGNCLFNYPAENIVPAGSGVKVHAVIPIIESCLPGGGKAQVSMAIRGKAEKKLDACTSSGLVYMPVYFTAEIPF